MQPLTAAGLLTAWERGHYLAPAAQALLLLATAMPDASDAWLQELTVGQRDAGLLTLRQWLFGAELSSVAYCPACGQPLSFAVPVSDMLLAELPALAESTPPDAYRESWQAFTVEFRLPTAGDMLALSAAQAGEQRQLLLEQCVLSARHGATDVAAAALPEPLVATVAARMAAADPQADIQFKLACPHCGHAWSAPFDIVSYFWQEIDVWARRIVQEVHLLASAYGWSEADILALSPLRRQLYLAQI